jgi:opacity protein-like surface antigen
MVMSRFFRRAALAAALVCGAALPAAAQLGMGPIVGAATAHIGTASGSDGRGTTLSAGGSVAVVESTGWGVEFDAGFASDDQGRSGGLDIQSYVLNLIVVRPKGRLRPFGTLGAGALRASLCDAACPDTTTWTDVALSAGGGVVYLLSETWGLRGDVRYFSTISDHPDPPRSAGVQFWRVAAGATFLWSAQ